MSKSTSWTGEARSFDGTPIVFDTSGSGTPALVFIHGWCCNRGQFAAQMKAFSPDRRVVALDLGGHGESGKGRASWQVTDLARDVEAVVTHLDLNEVILVGHSMGGPVSLEAAARMPDRVLSVIGIDTLHNVELKMSDAMRQRFIDAFEGDMEGAMARFVRGGLSPDAPESLIERITREAIATPKEVAVGLIASTADINLKHMMAACPVPVRCINASKPNQTNVEANRRHAPAFEVTLLEGVRHFPMLEAPERFNTVLREQIAVILGD